MKRRRVILAAGLAVAAAAAVVVAQPSAPAGYLAGHEPGTIPVVPQAPAPGSPRDLLDRQIFHATRALQGSPRWALAQNDVQLDPTSILADFSCAAGRRLTPQNAPALVAVLRRLYPDLQAAYGAPKDLYRRPRPYLRDEGAICTPRSKALDESFDYPSGHATFAWVYGLILAQALPDRTAALLQRARAFGESRAVCGVHSASAVGESRTAGSVLFAALQSDPKFREDLEAARRELLAIQAQPDEAACKAESELTARTPW